MISRQQFRLGILVTVGLAGWGFAGCSSSTGGNSGSGGDSSEGTGGIPSGMKRVNWLSFLGTGLVDRFGGIAPLKDVLTGPAIELHTGRNNVVIEAGRAPGIGDVNRRERLEPYHEVGRALAPVRSRTHPPFLAGPGGPIDEELSAEWLGWFDA